MTKHPHHNPSFSQVNQRVTQKRRKDLLAIDITIMLVLKLIVIYGLWYAFFSQPLDDHLTSHAVGSAMFGSSELSSDPAQITTQGKVH